MLFSSEKETGLNSFSSTAMTDLVERLRALARNYADGVAGMKPQDHFAWEAADEIERLERLRKGYVEEAQSLTREIERLRVKGEEAALAFAKRREQMSAEIERLREAIYEIGNHCSDHDRAIETLQTIEIIVRETISRYSE